MIELTTPFSEEAISQLNVGDVVSISGYIYTGRDAVLPKIIKAAEEGSLGKLGIDLQGSVNAFGQGRHLKSYRAGVERE